MMKTKNQARKLLAVISLLMSLGVLLVASWPLPSMRDVVPFPPTQVEVVITPPMTSVEVFIDAVLKERRVISFEWPEKIRLGDSDIFQLTLEMDETGSVTPTLVVEGQQVTGTPVEVPDLYDTHNLVAEARLDLAGADVMPQGSVQEPLRRGQTLNFYWSVHPQQVGRTRGTLWLFLNVIPRKGGDSERKALLSKQIELETVSVLGVPANLARWFGAIGAVVSVVLGFPFIESVLKRIWKKDDAAKEEQTQKKPE